MQHLGTKRIETERLILRRFHLDDAQAMFQNWASDPEVTRFLTWPTHESVEISSMVLADWTSHYGEDHYYQWAIELKGLGQPIGSVAAFNLNEQVSRAEVGYCIGRPWWHQGIMTEALDAIISYLIDDVGLIRVEAYHDVRNPHSGDVMRKCGMQYEGTQRSAGINNLGICDLCWYGILASDRRKQR